MTYRQTKQKQKTSQKDIRQDLLLPFLPYWHEKQDCKGIEEELTGRKKDNGEGEASPVRTTTRLVFTKESQIQMKQMKIQKNHNK